MLHSFLIKNFRLFEMLKIERLGRLNLMVGRNNSGKSAFLEAVELYVSNASTQVIINLVTNRHEVWKGQPQAENESIGMNPVRHLFHDHVLPSLGNEGITLGTVSPEEQLHIDIVAYQVSRDESGVITRTPIEEPGELPQDLSDLEFALIARENGRSRRILRLDRELDREADIYRRNAALLGASQDYNVEVVPTKNMTDERLATLWDRGCQTI